MRGIAGGQSSKEIAALLDIAPSTVDWHVANALVKLQAANRTEGVVTALQRGELGRGPWAIGHRAGWASGPWRVLAAALALTLVVPVVVAGDIGPATMPPAPAVPVKSPTGTHTVPPTGSVAPPAITPVPDPAITPSASPTSTPAVPEISVPPARPFPPQPTTPALPTLPAITPVPTLPPAISVAPIPTLTLPPATLLPTVAPPSIPLPPIRTPLPSIVPVPSLPPSLP